MAPEHEARTQVLYDHEMDQPGRRRHAVADWGVAEDIFDRMPSRRFTRAQRRAAHSGTVVISRDPEAVRVELEPAGEQRRFVREPRRRERVIESWTDDDSWTEPARRRAEPAFAEPRDAEYAAYPEQRGAEEPRDDAFVARRRAEAADRADAWPEGAIVEQHRMDAGAGAAFGERRRADAWPEGAIVEQHRADVGTGAAERRRAERADASDAPRGGEAALAGRRRADAWAGAEPPGADAAQEGAERPGTEREAEAPADEPRRPKLAIAEPPARLVAASTRRPEPPRTAGEPAEEPHERRTVVISGHPGGVPMARPERPPKTAIERVGTRPDRIVAYAVALGFLLVLIAFLTTGQ